MRKALLAAAVAGTLVVLYAAAGYWLAPRLVRDALLERAARAGLELRLAQVRTDPFALRVHLDGVELRDLKGGTLAAAAGASADLAWASLWRREWIVQHAMLRQPGIEVNWPLPRNGQAPAGQPAFTVEKASIAEGAVRFAHGTRRLALEGIELEMSGLSSRADAPARYSLSARVAPGGTLAAHGTLALAPLAAQGELRVEALPVSTLWPQAQGRLQGSGKYSYEGERLVLRELGVQGRDLAYEGIELAQLALQSPKLVVPAEEAFEVSATAQLARWVPDGADLSIVLGALSAKGRLRIDEAARYQGALSVRDARFEERGSGNSLLGWQRLESADVSLRLSPLAIEVGELVAHAPSGRLVIGEDGRLNIAEILKGRNDEPREARSFQAAVRRLRIENGTLDFTDRSLDEDFAVVVGELSGAITGLSTAAGNPARVQLAGRVAKYGAARIEGMVNLDEPKSLTNVTASLRNIDLAALTPYVVRFAGYRVESGRLSAKLRYRVREGRLVGTNDLVFEQIVLGEKVRSAGGRDLPLELAVALLTDAQGRIDLDIPVRGDLNDPKFDLGGLVARAIGNVVRRVASAPFRALASLLGEGGTDLDRVRFEPGSAALSPPAQERVASVAKALAARPQLAVTVQGGYDPEGDLAALRRDAARREIARRAGYGGDAPLDFRDAKLLRAAEALFLARAGNLLELIRLRADERPYGRLLFERLVAATPVEPASAETLARARAEAVRTALLEHGVDAARVRLEGPASAQAAEDGVPTLLALGAEGAASAGATGN
jgi:hypothetical protein